MFRGVFKEHPVRFAFGNFCRVAETGILRHDTDPVAAKLLGGALISGALLTVLLDGEERYSMRMDYAGPVRGMMLDISGSGRVRGFIRNPHVMTEAADLDHACGENCTVTITKSINGKVLNSGQIETAFAEPEAALSYFFSVSDQIETEIRSVLLFRPEPAMPVRCASAIMLQALPDCDLDHFNTMREKLLSKEAGEILADNTLAPEEQLKKLAAYLCPGDAEAALEAVEVPAPRFECPCTAEKLWETAKVMLGEEDFAKLLEENPDPVIRCEFCGSEHHYCK